MAPSSKTPIRGALATPLGELCIWLSCVELETATLVPDRSGRGRSGTKRFSFRAPAATVELMMGAVEPEMPGFVTGDDCQAALWRVSAHAELSALHFWAALPHPPIGADDMPHTGEGLDVFTRRVADTIVSFGTENGEFLAARAARNVGAPARLSTELTIDTVQFTDQGIFVPFGGLRTHEVLEVHFVAAWAERQTDERRSVWCALGQSHKSIVQVLDCVDVLPG